ERTQGRSFSSRASRTCTWRGRSKRGWACTSTDRPRAMLVTPGGDSGASGSGGAASPAGLPPGSRGCVRGGVHIKAASGVRSAPQQVRFGRRRAELEETRIGAEGGPGGGAAGRRQRTWVVAEDVAADAGSVTASRGAPGRGGRGCAGSGRGRGSPGT